MKEHILVNGGSFQYFTSITRLPSATTQLGVARSWALIVHTYITNTGQGMLRPTQALKKKGERESSRQNFPMICLIKRNGGVWLGLDRLVVILKP